MPRSDSSNDDSILGESRKREQRVSLQSKSQVSLLSSNLNFKLPIKLSQNNYNFWRHQVLPAIRAFDLENFVLNPKTCPPKFVKKKLNNDKDSEDDEVVSQEFLDWKKTDQLLVCWLYSTLSEEIFGQITHCTTSYEIWITLERLFAQKSRARILQLKAEMQGLKKGSMSVSDFVLKMKLIGENLAAVGHQLLEEDLIAQVLGGLGPEFDPIVAIITAKTGEICLQEVQFLLMSFENRLAQHNTMTSFDMSHVSANYAYSSPGNNPRGNSSYRGRSGNRGKGGRFGGRTGSKVYCQLCGKGEHLVSACFKRFDKDFQGITMSLGGNSQRGQYQAHVGQFLRGQQNYFQGHQGSNTVNDQAWFIDSGATNHITADLNNMSIKSDYKGQDKLAVGQEYQESVAARGCEGWSVPAGSFNPYSN